MALVIRKGKNTARLIRRTWIPKGAKNGNTHAYAEELSLGSLSLSARSWPQSFSDDFPKGVAVLSEHEKALVQRVVFDAAKEREERLRLEAAERAADPVWRVEQATTSLLEAASLSEHRPVNIEALRALSDALASVRCIEPFAQATNADPLDAVLGALEAAATSVRDGHYGSKPPDRITSEKVDEKWKAIKEAVSGPVEGSLIRALQGAQLVTRRAGSAAKSSRTS
jgi:hypothetical protein